jgi:hypothetical protein
VKNIKTTPAQVNRIHVFMCAQNICMQIAQTIETAVQLILCIFLSRGKNGHNLDTFFGFEIDTAQLYAQYA